MKVPLAYAACNVPVSCLRIPHSMTMVCWMTWTRTESRSMSLLNRLLLAMTAVKTDFLPRKNFRFIIPGEPSAYADSSPGIFQNNPPKMVSKSSSLVGILSSRWQSIASNMIRSFSRRRSYTAPSSDQAPSSV